MAEARAEFFFELSPDLYKKIVLFDVTETVRIERTVYDDSGTIRLQDSQSMGLTHIAGFETAEDGLIVRHPSGGATYF